MICYKLNKNCYTKNIKVVLPIVVLYDSFMALWTILVSSRPKFELEEISQKFNFLLKGTVSGKFLKTFYALNKRPVKNGIKHKKCMIL